MLAGLRTLIETEHGPDRHTRWQTIAASKTGDLTFLVTERGTPFVKESFGNWFRDACREAGCPGSVHGLRKARATRAGENGATVHQLMALFGWKTEKMALIYTRKADRKRLAPTAAPVRCGSQQKITNNFKFLKFRWCPEEGRRKLSFFKSLAVGAGESGPFDS